VESLNVFGADSPEEAADRLVNVVGVALIIDGGVSLGKGLFVKPPAEPMAASTNVTRRPSSFRKATVRDAWENAKDGPTGGKLCPTCGKEASVPPGGAPRDWDIDHQPAWSKRDLSDMTRKEVLDEYNRGTRLECPHCNRGRGNREVAP
jgi:hypothetical protein